MLDCLAVGLGGFIGSVFRYLIGLIPMKTDDVFPLKTLVINIVGAFLIGMIVSCASKNRITNPQLVLFLKVGVCGGFTTFSTFAYEFNGLLSGGHAMSGILYALLSMILGVVAVGVGMAICR